MTEFWKGFAVGGGMIVAIGAQNAFLLRHGILRSHVFLVAFTCFFCDVFLMTLGVMGLGSAIQARRELTVGLAALGAAFLVWYAVRSFISAWKGEGELLAETGAQDEPGPWSVLFATLGITLLNPHVYLDTVVVVGGVAATLSQAQKWFFLAGALTASACWFFGLGYGARLLVPAFRNPSTWRVLDALIGFLMLWIASGLIIFAVSR